MDIGEEIKPVIFEPIEPGQVPAVEPAAPAVPATPAVEPEPVPA